MADAVSTNVLFSSGNKRAILLTNISDGTGESAVTKVDRSAFTGPDGTVPTYIIIEKIEYACDGMQVRLYWDHTADDIICILAGSGYFDWTEVGGVKPPQAPSAANDGDILLTTNAHTSGDAYTITLYVRFKD